MNNEALKERMLEYLEANNLKYIDGRYGRANEIANRLYELDIWMGRVQQDLAPIYRNKVKEK